MFGSKNRSRKESRQALIDSMPVDENGDVPEEYLRERHAARSARSRAADGRSTAKKVYPSRMPPEQAVSWVMNPGRYDIEGIDCQGKANVPRKGTKASKPKAPAKKPAKPKAKGPSKTKPKTPVTKAPAKPRGPSTPKAPAPVPSGPIPSKESGVVVSGKEITDIAKLCLSAGLENIPLGNDLCGIDSSHICALALSRSDGRGTFGLDNDAVRTSFASDIQSISALDPKAFYKVSLEGGELVFRKGLDFNDAVLAVSVLSIPTTLMANRISSNVPSSRDFDLDTNTLVHVLKQMSNTRAGQCMFESSKIGTYVRSSGGECGIEALVGSPVGGDMARASYPIPYLLPTVKAVSPYIDRAAMMQDFPLVMKGMFGEYGLTAFVSPRIEDDGGR